MITAVATEVIEEAIDQEQPIAVDQQQQQENPYRPIQQWFDAGNHLELTYDMKDQQKTQALYQVDGLYALVKKTYKGVNEKEAALLMEFVLHGLSSYSLISKKTLEGGIAFKDLMGSMLILQIFEIRRLLFFHSVEGFPGPLHCHSSQEQEPAKDSNQHLHSGSLSIRIGQSASLQPISRQSRFGGIEASWGIG